MTGPLKLPSNVLWAATPCHRRGSRFYPNNYKDYGNEGQMASLSNEEGRWIYRSGGSSDPYLIREEELADCVSGLSRPADVAMSFGIDVDAQEQEHYA